MDFALLGIHTPCVSIFLIAAAVFYAFVILVLAVEGWVVAAWNIIVLTFSMADIFIIIAT